MDRREAKRQRRRRRLEDRPIVTRINAWIEPAFEEWAVRTHGSLEAWARDADGDITGWLAEHPELLTRAARRGHRPW